MPSPSGSFLGVQSHQRLLVLAAPSCSMHLGLLLGSSGLGSTWDGVIVELAWWSPNSQRILLLEIELQSVPICSLPGRCWQQVLSPQLPCSCWQNMAGPQLASLWGCLLLRASSLPARLPRSRQRRRPPLSGTLCPACVVLCAAQTAVGEGTLHRRDADYACQVWASGSSLAVI